MRPKELRPYLNEFLPPLTIRIRFDKIIFPLYISSVSTKENAGITLYIIANCTVSAADSGSILYQKDRKYPRTERDFKEMIEKRINDLIRAGKANSVILYKDRIYIINEVFKILGLKNDYATNEDWYLTRIESRFGPENSIPDLEFVSDKNHEFYHIRRMSRKVRNSDLFFPVFFISFFAILIILPIAILILLIKIYKHFRKRKKN